MPTAQLVGRPRGTGGEAVGWPPPHRNLNGLARQQPTPAHASFLRVFCPSSDTSDSLSEAEETPIIIEAVREASLPTCTARDVLPFENIIRDTFPEATVSPVSQAALEVGPLGNSHPGFRGGGSR